MKSLPLLAEFIGTYLLALAILASGGNPFISGATLAVIFILIKRISGSHVNPAISLIYFMNGSLSIKEFASYVLVQCLGAAASLYTFKAFA
jgi:glycerol uptake facilitator-like aquaporin